MKQAKKQTNKIGTQGEVRSLAYRVLIEPIITEASTAAIEENKYIFKVAIDATKIQIKAAVEELYKVKVAAVNTLNVRRKVINYGRTPGFRAGSKKAIVKLKKGDSIELFKTA